MKKLLFVLTLLMLFPLTLTADDDDNRDDRGGRNGKIVLKDSDGRTVGEVVSTRHADSLVWVDFKRESALLFITPYGIGISWPHGPMLFFEKPDCDESGEVYTRPELIDQGWVRPKVVITPGLTLPPEPSFERIAYFAADPEMGMYSPQSELSPDGFCNSFFTPDPMHLWRVKKIKACRGSGGYDLHWCYPPPYDFDKK